MITNADITVYNHKYNKDTRLDEWKRTFIRGVHFYVDNKVSVGDGGLNSADVYKIRIPEDAECEKGYVPEDEYWKIPDITWCWTLQEGDVVVLGLCDIEIEKPSDLKNKHVKYCKITSWSDNRFGNLPHWRIGGE